LDSFCREIACDSSRMDRFECRSDVRRIFVGEYDIERFVDDDVAV